MDGTMDGCLPDIVVASQFSHGLSLTIPFRNFLALANAQCARSAKLNSLFLCPFDASLTRRKRVWSAWIVPKPPSTRADIKHDIEARK
jgi:hypothetical protein